MTKYLHADARDIADLVRDAAEILDFTEPVAVLMLGLLGHIPDTNEARTLVRQILAYLPSGSHLAICDGTLSEGKQTALDEDGKSPAVPYRHREAEEIASLFDGLEWVEPGFGPVSQWCPDQPPADVAVISSSAPPPVDEYGGVARKP